MGHVITFKVETESVRRGRAVLQQIIYSLNELIDKGKTPVKVTISTALCDDLRAFFDYAYDVFDGVLPQTLHGAAIVYEPGASRHIKVDCG